MVGYEEAMVVLRESARVSQRQRQMCEGKRRSERGSGGSHTVEECGMKPGVVGGGEEGEGEAGAGEGAPR
eukprot:2154948-Rhodomonas_salina.2